MFDKIKSSVAAQLKLVEGKAKNSILTLEEVQILEKLCSLAMDLETRDKKLKRVQHLPKGARVSDETIDKYAMGDDEDAPSS